MTLPANTPKGLVVEDVVVCIRQFMADNGYPPTQRQLAECLGVASKATANHWLRKAVAAGLIEVVVDGHHTKAIRIKEG